MYPENSNDGFTVIPAPPGYFILTYDRLPGVGEDISRDPIIAFRVPHGGDGVPVPITVFNGAWEGTETYIVGPDNAVDVPGAGRWHSYSAWLAEARERHSEAHPAREVYPEEYGLDALPVLADDDI